MLIKIEVINLNASHHIWSLINILNFFQPR